MSSFSPVFCSRQMPAAVFLILTYLLTVLTQSFYSAENWRNEAAEIGNHKHVITGGSKTFHSKKNCLNARSWCRGSWWNPHDPAIIYACFVFGQSCSIIWHANGLFRVVTGAHRDYCHLWHWDTCEYLSTRQSARFTNRTLFGCIPFSNITVGVDWKVSCQWLFLWNVIIKLIQEA